MSTEAVAPRRRGPRILRSRPAYVIYVLLAVLAVLVLVVVYWVVSTWAAMRSDTCEAWPYPQPTMDEVKDLKARSTAYQEDPAKDAVLDLSPDEVTFLLEGSSAYGLWLRADGSDLSAHLTVPVEDACYNVDFEGEAEVRSGQATLAPKRLRIGDVEWGSWVEGYRLRVAPSRLPDDAATRLKNIEKLDVVRGRLRVRMYDRWVKF